MIGAILSRNGPLPDHEGESQQPHRRPADAARSARGASPRRHRDGREPSRRNRAPRVDRRAGHRARDQRRAPLTSKDSDRSTASPRAKASSSRDCRRTASPSSMPTIDTRPRGARRPAGRRLVTFGVEQPADFTARDIGTSLDRTGRASSSIWCRRRDRARPSRARPGCTICGTRSARRRRRTPPERSSSDIAAGLGAVQAGQGPSRVQAGHQRRGARRRFVQRQPRHR